MADHEKTLIEAFETRSRLDADNRHKDGISVAQDKLSAAMSALKQQREANGDALTKLSLQGLQGLVSAVPIGKKTMELMSPFILLGAFAKAMTRGMAKIDGAEGDVLGAERTVLERQRNYAQFTGAQDGLITKTAQTPGKEDETQPGILRAQTANSPRPPEGPGVKIA